MRDFKIFFMFVLLCPFTMRVFGFYPSKALTAELSKKYFWNASCKLISKLIG